MQSNKQHNKTLPGRTITLGSLRFFDSVADGVAAVLGGIDNANGCGE